MDKTSPTSPSNARATEAGFYDAVENNDVNGRAPPLTEEEREQLKQDLKKTEDEIATLRQVLHTRVKDAHELKRRLGLTPWHEITEDLNQGIKNVKQSQAYQRTEEAIATAGEKVSAKLGQLRNSNAYKSFEEKVGSAYNNVKAKIVASTSIDQLSGHAKPDNMTSGPNTQPTTPSNEKASPMK